VPELPPDPLAPPASVLIEGSGDRLAQVQRFPPPYPGYPTGLEAMSAHERAWWGRRFGVDTPYLMTPAGWGEMIPLVPGDLFGTRYVIEGIDGPLADRLFPEDGLYPQDGLYPRS